MSRAQLSKHSLGATMVSPSSSFGGPCVVASGQDHGRNAVHSGRLATSRLRNLVPLEATMALLIPRVMSAI